MNEIGDVRAATEEVNRSKVIISNIYTLLDIKLISLLYFIMFEVPKERVQEI